MNRSLVAILLLLCSPLYAVEPKAVITGPSTAKPGTLVVLSSAGSVSDPGGLAWVFIDGKTQALEGLNNELGFVQGEAGRVIVGLVAVGTVDGKPKISIVKHPVEIGDRPAPDPTPPGPNPNPNPPAPLPDGRFKLAQWCFNEASKLGAPARALMPACADNFDATASAAAAGVLTTPEAMRDDSADRNIKTEGAQREACKAFFVPLNAQLKSLNATGGMKTLQDHIDAWREMAQGLRRVR